MTDVNDELRQALRRVEPPAGFAERVLQRAAGGGASTVEPGGGRMRRVPGRTFGKTKTKTMFRWAAAAVLALTVTGGAWYRSELRRQAQGEEAKRQVLLSLRMAGSKLQFVQAKVNQQGAQ